MIILRQIKIYEYKYAGSISAFTICILYALFTPNSIQAGHFAPHIDDKTYNVHFADIALRHAVASSLRAC